MHTQQKLNKGKAKLEEVLKMGNQGKTGIGYEDTVFVKECENTSKVQKVKTVPSVKPELADVNKKYRKRRYVCHHIFATGHIRAYCYKLKQELGLEKICGDLGRK